MNLYLVNSLNKSEDFVFVRCKFCRIHRCEFAGKFVTAKIFIGFSDGIQDPFFVLQELLLGRRELLLRSGFFLCDVLTSCRNFTRYWSIRLGWGEWPHLVQHFFYDRIFGKYIQTRTLFDISSPSSSEASPTSTSSEASTASSATAASSPSTG